MAICDALAEELPPGDLRAEVLTTVAVSGPISTDRAVADAEQAVAECTTDEQRARCLLGLSNVTELTDVERGLAIAKEAVVLLGPDGDPALRGWALTAVGACEIFARPSAEPPKVLAEAARLQREHGVVAPDSYLSAGTTLGIAMLLLDWLDDARELLAAEHEVRDSAHRGGEPDPYLLEASASLASGTRGPLERAERGNPDQGPIYSNIKRPPGQRRSSRWTLAHPPACVSCSVPSSR
jgi:hypothetical protein